MTIDINRKVSFLDKDFALDSAHVEKILDDMNKSAALKKKSSLQLQKFSAAALTLAHYRDQVNGNPANNAPAVSAKEAELAWKTLSSVSKSVANKYMSNSISSSGLTETEANALRSYSAMAVEFDKVFSLEAKHEAQLRSVPENTQLFRIPEVEETHFSPKDALPYLENLEATKPTEALARISGSPLLARHPELEFERFRTAGDYLSEYGRQPSAGMTAAAANAFADIREHAPTVIRRLDRMLAGMNETNPDYEALRDYRAVLMQYDHTVKSTDAKEQIRSFKNGQKHFEDVREAARELLKPIDPLDESIDFDGGALESDEPTAADQRFAELKGAVTGYRAHVHDNAFELEYASLERQIAEKERAIPAEVRKAFRNVNSLEDLARMEQEATVRMEKHLPDDKTLAGRYPEYVREITELRVLEMKKAVLADSAPAQYAQYEREAEARIQKLPGAAVQDRIKDLAEQLNSLHKFGRNTQEYRDFRDALNEAAVTGDYTKLHDLAEAYVGKKTAGGKAPTSANGVARLSVAHAVLDLLDKNAENRILSSLPTEEEEEEMEAEAANNNVDEVSIDSILFGENAPDFPDEEEEKDAEELHQDAADEPQFQDVPEQPASQELSKEEAFSSDETINHAQDQLHWKPDKQGEFTFRMQLHGWVTRELYYLKPEIREAEAEKVYEFINRHLTGNDINGPVNFMRAMKQEFFESKDGQPPLLDRSKHPFYLSNIMQSVLDNSDFAERQADLYMKMKNEGPEGFHPMADTPLIPESPKENSVARGLAARERMFEKVQQAALEKVYGYIPDDALELYDKDEIKPNANLCSCMTKEILLGDQMTAAAVANMPEAYLYHLYKENDGKVLAKQVKEDINTIKQHMPGAHQNAPQNTHQNAHQNVHKQPGMNK